MCAVNINNWFEDIFCNAFPAYMSLFKLLTLLKVQEQKIGMAAWNDSRMCEWTVVHFYLKHKGNQVERMIGYY